MPPAWPILIGSPTEFNKMKSNKLKFAVRVFPLCAHVTSPARLTRIARRGDHDLGGKRYLPTGSAPRKDEDSAAVSPPVACQGGLK